MCTIDHIDYVNTVYIIYVCITVVSRASAHSQVSAQARSLQSRMASVQAAPARQQAKGRLHQGTFHQMSLHKGVANN